MDESAYGSQQHAQDFKAVIDYFGIGNKRPILAGWYVWDIEVIVLDVTD